MKTLHYILALLFVFGFPMLVHACPMCQGGEGFSKSSVFAYKLTTAFLASLPVLMGLGIFWWVRKKFRNV